MRSQSQAHVKKLLSAALLALASLSFNSAHASAANTDLVFMAPAKAGVEEPSKVNPNDYVPTYSNGLYSTVAGFLNVKDAVVKGMASYQIQVPGFKSRVTVKAVIQPRNAPLVVLIPGLDGKADSKLCKLWPAYYSEAGYHVLTFDSTFNWSFNALSGHGATGHVGVEAQCVRDMIAQFLKMDAIKGKVDKIGIVGMSYGGLQALMLGEMARDKNMPFKIDAIQAWSPPVNLYRTCEILDQWYAEDRWNYTLPELAGKLSNHKPVQSDRDIPFTDDVMRAGIAAVFRLGLADTIVKNDKAYRLNLLPADNGGADDNYVRQDYAAAWGFQKFVADLTFPYWQKKLKLGSLDEMTSSFTLRKLLPAQDARTEVILAADDPFNDAGELAALNGVKKDCSLTVLKGGGHLGFVSDNWTKARLLTLFSKSAPQGAKLLTSK